MKIKTVIYTMLIAVLLMGLLWLIYWNYDDGKRCAMDFHGMNDHPITG